MCVALVGWWPASLFSLVRVLDDGVSFSFFLSFFFFFFFLVVVGRVFFFAAIPKGVSHFFFSAPVEIRNSHSLIVQTV